VRLARQRAQPAVSILVLVQVQVQVQVLQVQVQVQVQVLAKAYSLPRDLKLRVRLQPLSYPPVAGRSSNAQPTRRCRSCAVRAHGTRQIENNAQIAIAECGTDTAHGAHRRGQWQGAATQGCCGDVQDHTVRARQREHLERGGLRQAQFDTGDGTLLDNLHRLYLEALGTHRTGNANQQARNGAKKAVDPAALHALPPG
jgi:hypothetical protein